MGFLDALFGSKTTEETNFDVPQTLQNTLNQSQIQAQNVFGAGFTPYTDQRFAGFNTDQQTAFDLMRSYATDPNSLAGRLQDQSLQRFMGAPTAGDLQPFENAYLDNVLDRSKQNNLDFFDSQLAKMRAGQEYQSAYGGSRNAVLESEMGQNILNSQRDLDAQMRFNARDAALDRYFKTGSEGFNLAQGAQNRAFDQANALLGIGGQQQALDQAGLDFQHQEFMRSINEPKQDAIQLATVGNLYPTNIIDSTRTTTSTPSLFDSIAAVAGLAMGVGGGFGLGGGGSIPAGAASYSGGSYLPSDFNSYGTGSTGLASTAADRMSQIYGTGMKKDGGMIRKKYRNPFDDNGVKKMAAGGLLEDDDYEDRWGVTGNFDNITNYFKNVKQQEKERHSKLRNKKTDMFDKENTSKGTITPTIDDILNVLGVNQYNSDKPKQISKNPSLENQSRFTPPSPQPKINNTTNIDPFTDFGLPKFEPEQKQDDWLDRWADNPLTKLGLTLLSGTDTAFGRAADKFLTNERADDVEQTRQRELAQQREFERQQAIFENQQAIERGQRAVRELDINEERYTKDYAADMARIAAMKLEGNEARKFTGLVGDKKNAADNVVSLQKEYADAQNEVTFDPSGSVAKYYEQAISNAVIQYNAADRRVKEALGESSGGVSNDPYGLR